VRVAFFGTPEFAVPSLEHVLAVSEVAVVVTRPDRPRGRGLRVTPPPVAEVATRYALEVLQPPSLRDPAFLRRLRELAPDLLVAVAFGRLIPPEVLQIPPLGGINLHPSLLPRYRGAAPIPRAIAAGETETGVTVLSLSQELDAGDIILQRRVPIDPTDTSRTLEGRLAREGAALLAEALPLVESGKAPRVTQDAALVTFAPKLSREEALIRWSDPAARIVNLVRALDPWPVAYTVRNDEPLRIWRAKEIHEPGGREGGARTPGAVLRTTAEGLVVASGQGFVLVQEVQPAAGRRMLAAEYVRGHPLPPGTVLGGAGRTPSSRPEA
jgi:methionyl-tRNA formyltransferase